MAQGLGYMANGEIFTLRHLLGIFWRLSNMRFCVSMVQFDTICAPFRYLIRVSRQQEARGSFWYSWWHWWTALYPCSVDGPVPSFCRPVIGNPLLTIYISQQMRDPIRSDLAQLQKNVDNRLNGASTDQWLSFDFIIV